MDANAKDPTLPFSSGTYKSRKMNQKNETKNTKKKNWKQMEEVSIWAQSPFVSFSIVVGVAAASEYWVVSNILYASPGYGYVFEAMLRTSLRGV